MIKVGILMFQNMQYAPFLKMYEKVLQAIEDVTYDVIYYERDRSLGEIKDLHHIALPWRGEGTLAASKAEKLANFILYRYYARDLLKKKKYDFLIVLTSFPAVLLTDYLTKYYAGRYLVDIRDYTQENFRPYFWLEKKVFSKAAMCVISSPGFVNFLPKQKYYTCHNIDADAATMKKNAFIKAAPSKIVVSYIGSISYEVQCKQFIDLVVNDERFEFHLYGNEANGTEVSEYVLQVNNPRVKMMGPFQPKDKPRIYAQSDLVFNCYGNDRALVQYAISNKYYDGAIFRKPLLVSPNTSMSEVSKNFAFALDLGNARDLENLYRWYQEIDGAAYTRYADDLIQKAIYENAELLSVVKNCVIEAGRM